MRGGSLTKGLLRTAFQVALIEAIVGAPLLYALTQFSRINDEKQQVTTQVIAHNGSPTDKAARIIAQNNALDGKKTVPLILLFGGAVAGGFVGRWNPKRKEEEMVPSTLQAFTPAA